MCKLLKIQATAGKPCRWAKGFVAFGVALDLLNIMFNIKSTLRLILFKRIVYFPNKKRDMIGRHSDWHLPRMGYNLSWLKAQMEMRLRRIKLALKISALVLAYLATPVKASWFGPNVDAVKEMLNDPYSAKFENVKKQKSGAVCGEVNYKNQYGAYIGRQPFAIWNGKAFIGDGDAREVLLYCVKTPQCIDEECVDAARNANIPIHAITRCNTKECINSAVEIKKQEDVEAQAEVESKAMLTAAQKQCLSHLPDSPDLMLSCNSKLQQCRATEIASERLHCLMQIIPVVNAE